MLVMAAALCLLLTAVSVLPSRAHAAETGIRASAIRIGHGGKTTRFVADLSSAVGFNVFVLPDPYRVIVDLPEVTFDVPERQQTATAGVIAGYRFGQMEAGRSRIVMDVSGPVLIKRSFLLRKTEKAPAKLVVDLIKTDEATFARMHVSEQPAAPPAPEPAETANTEVDAQSDNKPDETENTLSQLQRAQREIKNALTAMLSSKPVPIPRPKPDETPAALTKPASKPKPASARRVVVIDPGHGGIDPGAVSRRGTEEKTIVLEFARELRKQLRKSGKYEVVMTRNEDTFLSLRDRVRIARKHQADLFIAVHADSVRGRRARGATIYTVSEKASDREAEELARKENRSDIIAGVDLASENDDITGILIDLAQRETNNHSLFFAKKMLQQVKGVARMNARPLRSAGFRVLKAPDVPSVLFELGYLSSRDDERYLTSGQWQRRTAAALAQAVGNYFATKLAAR